MCCCGTYIHVHNICISIGILLRVHAYASTWLVGRRLICENGYLCYVVVAHIHVHIMCISHILRIQVYAYAGVFMCLGVVGSYVVCWVICGLHISYVCITVYVHNRNDNKTRARQTRKERG